MDKAEIQELNESERKDLRRSHFTMGDAVINYKSEAMESFSNPEKEGKNKFEQGLLNGNFIVENRSKKRTLHSWKRCKYV